MFNLAYICTAAICIYGAITTGYYWFLAPVIIVYFLILISGFFTSNFNLEKVRGLSSITSYAGQSEIAIQIGALQIKKFSPEIIGTLDEVPIHDYIVAKYQARDEWQTYYFKEKIHKDENEKLILERPSKNQVYTQTGLVYELREDANEYNSAA